jgi:hypothetical protein
MPPIECPTIVALSMPRASSSALVEAELISLGLVRFAEADLVRSDHPITGLGQAADRPLPGRAAKVLTVQQHDRAPVRVFRRDIHKRHLQRLSLTGDIERLGPERIVEPFQPSAVGRPLRSGFLSRYRLRYGDAGKQDGKREG